MFKIVALTVLLGLAVADHIDHDAQTKNFKNDISADGNYVYAFDTTNGIAVQESGSAAGSSGSAQFISPEGTAIKLNYVANENGFQPSGDHLPVGPAVPEAILRALEYIRTHPNQEERAGGSHNAAGSHNKKHF